jgi:ankyrin repeat protein
MRRPFARKNTGLIVALVTAAVLFAGCAQSKNDKPNPEAAKQLLKLRGYEFDVPSFFAAADATDVWAVNTFLAAGINPNSTQQNGETVLMRASRRGHIAIMKALLSGGADVNAKDGNGHTALVSAADNRETAVANTLLADSRVDVNSRSANGAGILAIYVARNREDIVPELLKRGAQVDVQDQEGDAAMHGAALNGNVNLLRLLLEKGANPNIRNKVGGTPLMWAVSYGNSAATQLLLEKGADPAIKDVDGLTAADWAKKTKHTELIKIIEDAER